MQTEGETPEPPKRPLVTVEDAWANYGRHSGSASSNARKLCFTGIALIWIFSGGGLFEETTDFVIHPHYRWPLFLLLASLACDFLQYVYLTIVWRVIARSHENGDRLPFDAPDWTNLAGEAFWVVKISLVAVGYGWLVVALWPRLIG